AKTIAFMLTHAESRVLLVDPEFKTLAEEALTLINQDIIVIDVFDEEYDAEQIALGQYEYESCLAQGDPEFEWLLPQDEWDAISLNYTSGTTG
ncbi:acyl-CoA synthetase, partial [Acinetobacter variabilis]